MSGNSIPRELWPTIGPLTGPPPDVVPEPVERPRPRVVPQEEEPSPRAKGRPPKASSPRVPAIAQAVLDVWYAATAAEPLDSALAEKVLRVLVVDGAELGAELRYRGATGLVERTIDLGYRGSVQAQTTRIRPILQALCEVRHDGHPFVEAIEERKHSPAQEALLVVRVGPPLLPHYAKGIAKGTGRQLVPVPPAPDVEGLGRRQSVPALLRLQWRITEAMSRERSAYARHGVVLDPQRLRGVDMPAELVAEAIAHWSDTWLARAPMGFRRADLGDGLLRQGRRR